MASTIYTIGHSTRDLSDFLDLLKEQEIKLLVDVRSLPGSNKFPQYNQDDLKISLNNVGIDYFHCAALGGRRPKVEKNTTSWRNTSFANYASYMKTAEFKAAIKNLEECAMQKRAVLMCAEAVWWRCHRSMIADYLKANGWEILHIINKQKLQQHPFTSPAKLVNGKLTYEKDGGTTLQD